MHPDFIHIGPLDIHMYGVLVAIGFMGGLWVAARRAPSEGIKPDQIADLGVWLIISGMLGGKLFHIIFFWDEFIAGWREMGIRSLREGFVFYGGFILAVLTAVVYTRVKTAVAGENPGRVFAVSRARSRLWPARLLLQRLLLRQGVRIAVGRPVSAPAPAG